MIIDYDIVRTAISYYQNIGYKYIEVPWIVSTKAISITCPRFIDAPEEDSMIASGEQGFLEMIKKGHKLDGKYVCATPCYRPYDENASPFHFKQFFKVELGVFCTSMPSSADYMKVQSDVLNFMKTYSPGCYFQESVDDLRQGCITFLNDDILTKDKIEIGSCGIRSSVGIGYWIYATGAALPRLSQVYNL